MAVDYSVSTKYSLSMHANTRPAGCSHFNVKEFACHDGSDTVYINPKLPPKLDQIWNWFAKLSSNSVCLITINSGYRTESYNKKVGGATQSQHLTGSAADIVVTIQNTTGAMVKVAPADVYKAAVAIGFGGAIVYDTFTHVDVRASTYHSQGSGSTSSTGTFSTELNDDSPNDTFNIYDEKYTAARNLLSPSDYERRYGISVYDANQPLIKFSTAQGVDETNALLALKKYAKYIFYMLNSALDVATITLPGAPWIRPGVNVWIDPIGIDKIYYVNRVQHTGSAASNSINTTLSLSFGRDRVKFLDGRVNFGSLKQPTEDIDNVFVNNFYQTLSSFGSTLKKGDYARIRDKMFKFYQGDGGEVIQALGNEHFKYFYGKSNTDGKQEIKKKANSGKSSFSRTSMHQEFSSIADIQDALNTMYAGAPSVVKTRCSNLSRVLREADAYILTHYESEMMYNSD